MHPRGFERTALAKLIAAACAAFFGACVAAYAVDPQFVQPVPATPPVFNPSSPNVVPQPSYRPVSPAGSSTAPAPGVYPYVAHSVVPRTARSHRHAATTRVTKTHHGRIVHHHRGTAIITEPGTGVYYYPYTPLFHAGYGCGWRKAWDNGYWYRTPPCY